MIQYEHLVHRTAFIAEGEDDDDSCDDEDEKFFDSDDDDDDIPILENVIMQQDSKNFCYYVTRSKG